MITRVRYFTGQLLGVADFETEQRYVIESNRRRNRWLHGWGIVGGLQVSTARSEVVVAPGFALDCVGNEIEVEEPARWPLPDGMQGKARYLVLTFTEHAASPVPAMTERGDGEGEAVAYSRVDEGWALAYTPEDPASGHGPAARRTPPCGRAHGIALARLVRTDGRWRIDPRYRVGRARV